VSSVAGHKRNRLLLSLDQKVRVDEQWATVIRAKGYSWSGGYVSLTSSENCEMRDQGTLT
jgi:hypothetical protein